MDALKPRGKGLVRMMTRKEAWIATAMMVASVGCKVGNPMDRTVKVTQQPSQDALDLPSPQTRLATDSPSRESDPPVAEASVAQASWRTESDGSPHEAGRSGRAEPRTTVARKAPSARGTPAALPAQSHSGSLAASKLDNPIKPDSPMSQAELLEAFRDSPPEIQQQALRQLLAVTGHSATKTGSPQGITAALQSSVNHLPALPEDAEEPTTLPSRLASNQPLPSPPVDAIQASAEADGETASQDPIALTSGESNEPLAPSQSLLPSDSRDSNEPLAPSAAATDSKPTPASGSLTDAELYAELAKRLEQAVPGESEADRYRRQIISRHLMMFAGNPDAAVAALDGMKQTEQDFLRHYLLGVWAMIDTHGHPVAARRWSAALPEMRQATQQLSASAESLDVRSLAFCKEIQSFGQITAFESKRFEAGQKVILYCEIDNFLAQSTADGFETHLQGSYEIFDSQGQKVAGQVLPADKQLCANQLRDYFIAYQMNLPTNLDAGDYRLELTMECLKGQKYGQASIPLAINRPAATR